MESRCCYAQGHPIIVWRKAIWLAVERRLQGHPLVDPARARAAGDLAGDLAGSSNLAGNQAGSSSSSSNMPGRSRSSSLPSGSGAGLPQSSSSGSSGGFDQVHESMTQPEAIEDLEVLARLLNISEKGRSAEEKQMLLDPAARKGQLSVKPQAEGP